MLMNNNEEAVKIVNALKPVIKSWNEEWNRNSIRAKQMTVKTAPNGSTMGVIDAFSNVVMDIPYSVELSSAVVGDTVWCVWMGNNMQTLVAMWKGQINETRIGYPGQLLWTNESPTSDFEAQTVALDLTKYRFVVIEFSNADGTYPKLETIPVDIGQNYIASSFGYNAYTIYMFTRILSITPATGIAFQGGYSYDAAYESSSTANDGFMIPKKIYAF